MVPDVEQETPETIHPLLVDGLNIWLPERCARELRMSERTLRNMGKKGPPKVRLGGRVWYRPEGVRKWLEARER